MPQTNPKFIEPLFKGLADRQRAVLMGRFGLGASGEKETLDSIGKKFGITRERVRQLRDRALIRLREGETGERLKDLVA